MSLVGFKARNHTQQVSKRGANPLVDNRATPPEVFAPLHERFGFTLDACALPSNAKLPHFFTPEDDGLRRSWGNHVVWCNPPFSDIYPWVTKAHLETRATVVMLLPANRTEQRWWQEMVEPYRDGRGYRLTVEFLPGRLRFLAPGEDTVKPNSRPPFGCCLLIWQ